MSIKIDNRAKALVSNENGVITWNAYWFFSHYFELADYRTAAVITDEYYTALITYSKDASQYLLKLYTTIKYRDEYKSDLQRVLSIILIAKNNYLHLDLIKKFVIEFDGSSKYKGEEIDKQSGIGLKYLCQLIHYVIKKEQPDTGAIITLDAESKMVSDKFYHKNGFKSTVNNELTNIATVGSFMEHCTENNRVIDLIDYIVINGVKVYRMLYYYSRRLEIASALMVDLFGRIFNKSQVKLDYTTKNNIVNYEQPLSISITGVEASDQDITVQLPSMPKLVITTKNHGTIKIEDDTITLSINWLLASLFYSIPLNYVAYSDISIVHDNKDYLVYIYYNQESKTCSVIVYPSSVDAPVSGQALFRVDAKIDGTSAIIYEIEQASAHPYSTTVPIIPDRLYYIKMLIKYIHNYRGVNEITITDNKHDAIIYDMGFDNPVVKSKTYNKLGEETQVLHFTKQILDLNLSDVPLPLRIIDYIKQNEFNLWLMLYYYENKCRKQANELSRHMFGVDVLYGRSLKRINVEPYTGSLFYTIL